jgi:hypothetical protein
MTSAVGAVMGNILATIHAERNKATWPATVKLFEIVTNMCLYIIANDSAFNPLSGIALSLTSK